MYILCIYCVIWFRCAAHSTKFNCISFHVNMSHIYETFQDIFLHLIICSESFTSLHESCFPARTQPSVISIIILSLSTSLITLYNMAQVLKLPTRDYLPCMSKPLSSIFLKLYVLFSPLPSTLALIYRDSLQTLMFVTIFVDTTHRRG